MRHKIHIVCCFAIVSVFALAGCKNKDEQIGKHASSSSVKAVKKETTITVPSTVKGKWKAVKIAVTEKKTNKESVLTIPIGSTVTIPNSKVVIRVENFLPHFTMEGSTVTSLTNELKNPAAMVHIDEDGRSISKGWLFSLYPTTNPLQHSLYTFALVDFIPAN